VINGAHVILGSTDAEADRAFIRDVLGFEFIDSGAGWLIFALPPAEVAVHPGKEGEHRLYLMCDDLDATLEELKRRGASVSAETSEQSWGRLRSIRLPGGGELGIYQPKHPSPQRRK
jgi:catechol 2,3-dioxygenase-like lactoylglutathione lyase family enzyme